MKNLKTIIISGLLVVIIGGYILYQWVYKSTAPAPIANTTEQSDQTQTQTQPMGYKDGVYTGDAVNAFYGTVQVKTTVSGGKITDVEFLQYPNGAGHTIQLSNQVMPVLKSEAIAAQTANVDVISGATQTSQAFMASLQSTLVQAGAQNTTQIQVTAPHMGM